MKKQPYQRHALLRPPWRPIEESGSKPCPCALIASVWTHCQLADTGYLVTTSVVWKCADHKPLYRGNLGIVPDWTFRCWQPFTCRPGLRDLLQLAARRVWAISTSQPIGTWEGQDPIPGLEE